MVVVGCLHTLTGYCGTFRCCRPRRLRPAQDGAVKEKAWTPHEDVQREDSGFNASFTQGSVCSAELIIQPESSAWLPRCYIKVGVIFFLSFFFFITTHLQGELKHCFAH